MTYRYARDTWGLYDETNATIMGFKMVGNSLMQRGEYEPEETQIVTKIISQVEVFINIGANIGYYCCIALHHGKKLTHVVAFEPVYHNLLYLLRNIKANSWECPIEIYPLALSHTAGILEIFGGGPQASLVRGWGRRPGQYGSLVPSSTLNNVLGARFQGKTCLILVDVEGSERMMLEGASSFLERDPKPIWMIEIAVSEHQPEGITVNPHLSSTFETFWNRGYEAWTADKQCRLVRPEDIEDVANGGKDTFHTHNFLFIGRGMKHELLDVSL